VQNWAEERYKNTNKLT